MALAEEMSERDDHSGKQQAADHRDDPFAFD